MQGSASLSLCARRQPKRWWVVQWKNSESTDILEVVFQVAQENENHLKRLHSNDSIDLLTYMLGHGELREKIAILRRLQEYTVSLFDYEYKILNEKHAISIASEDFDICVLNGDYYKGEYGVVTETDMSLLMI